ncbi:MAG: AtpZ/AtpI family protein [Clostridiales bacterium]
MVKNSSQYSSPILILLRVTLTFGIGTALRIYILAVLGGNWLDQELGCQPLFFILGFLIAIIISFYHLFEALRLLDRSEKTVNRNKEDK